MGRRVALLADEEQSAGHKEVTLDGSGLASGVYIFRLQIEDYRKTGRLVHVK